jgi:hypothetical protein|tara:strand:- start:623 stop:871 length:249 start_codon:yes stop_codon:yes gene_type:complete
MSHLNNDELQQNLFEASKDEKFQYVEQRKLKMIDDMWEHHFYNLPVIDLIILAKQQFKDKHCLNTADEIVDKYNEIFQKGEK